jgi:hypothetical protein
MPRTLTCAVLALITISRLALGQDPPTPVPPVPPEAPTPRASQARPAPPALPGIPGAQEAPAPLGGGKSLRDPIPMGTLLDEAGKATGLDRDALRPAVEALRASMWCDRCGGSRMLKFSGAQGQTIRTPCPACQGANDPAAADARLGVAIEALPAEKRELFVAWAMAKRKQAGERGLKWRVELSDTARDRARAMLEAERELQATKRELDAVRLPTEKEWEALAKARESLVQHERYLADAMGHLARLRIEDTLDKSLLADRYRDLATNVDEAKARELAERLRSLAETRPEPGSGPLEQRLEDLKARRDAIQADQRKIDAAIEQAMAELLRERAERLHVEAMRKVEEAVREAQKRDRDAEVRTATQQPPVPPSPPSPAQPPAAPRAQEDEVRQLREELKRLREEVETLRKKSEPK